MQSFKKFVELNCATRNSPQAHIDIRNLSISKFNSVSAHSTACIYVDKSQKMPNQTTSITSVSSILWSIAQQNRFKPDFLNRHCHCKHVKSPRKLQKHPPLLKINRHTQNIMCLQTFHKR